MTTTPTHTPNALDRFADLLRRSPVVRSDNRHLGGVCGGLAERSGLSPAIVRLLTVVLAVFAIGVPLYLLAWLLLPNRRGEIHLTQALQQGKAASIVLLVFAAFAVLPSGPHHENAGFWIGAVTVAVIYFAVKHARRASQPQPPTGPTGSQTPQDAPHW